MIFTLGKLAIFLLSPLSVVLALWATAGAAMLLRRPAWTRRLAIAGAMVLWICSTPAVSSLLSQPLDFRYQALRPEDAPKADAILMLGGALIGAKQPERPIYGLGPAAGRVWHAANLYRAGRAPVIIVAGGNQVAPRPGEQVEADAVAEMLAAIGVPPDAVRIEGESRTTRENAVNSLAIARSLHAKRVLLVTSARHMRRALLTFRKVWQGADIELIPAVTDVPDRTDWGVPATWEPSLSGLGNATLSIKEYAGMLALQLL